MGGGVELQWEHLNYDPVQQKEQMSLVAGW